MAWECSDCGQKEQGQRKITACHHCGKAVCKSHRRMIDDEAFSAWPDQDMTRIAVHCLDCCQAYHSQAMDVETGLASAQGLTTA